MSETAQTPAGRSLSELRGMGKQVARDVGGTSVQQFFEANKAAIAQVLPRHISPDRMLKIALRCLRTTPKLMLCTLDSLMGAVITCAQMGLEPNTPQGHIYLIPFENKRKGVVEVQVIVGYKGLVDLARRSGEIESISARVVHVHDRFEMSLGTDEEIIHKPCLDRDPGEPVGFYSIAKLKGGGTQFEWMSLEAINRIRDRSQGYISAKMFAKGGKINSPWATDYEEMGRKTCIRRLCKYLPMSIELAGAVALDERGDRGMQDMSKVLDGVDYTEVATQDDEEQDEDAEQGAGTQQIEQDKSVHVDVTGGSKPEPEKVASGAGPSPKRTRAAKAEPAPQPSQQTEGDGRPEPPVEGELVQRPAAATASAPATTEPTSPSLQSADGGLFGTME